MNLYLNNQKRDRDLNEYLNKLCIDKDTYNGLNQKGKKVLLIGGGYSLLKPQFILKTVIDFINIDLDPPKYDSLDRLKNIKGNFIEINEYVDEFDEVWALCSLPLYSPNEEAVYIFILKSILAIKATGVVRFFPLEFDSSPKIHTKDADYSMTTMECTESVLNAIDYVGKIGVMCRKEIVNMNDENRMESVVFLYLDSLELSKQEINSLLLKKIEEFKTNYPNCWEVNVIQKGQYINSKHGGNK